MSNSPDFWTTNRYHLSITAFPTFGPFLINQTLESYHLGCRIRSNRSTSGDSEVEVWSKMEFFAPTNWIKTWRFWSQQKMWPNLPEQKRENESKNNQPTKHKPSPPAKIDQETLISWTFNSSSKLWYKEGHPRSRQVATFVKGTDSCRTCTDGRNRRHLAKAMKRKVG